LAVVVLCAAALALWLVRELDRRAQQTIRSAPAHETLMVLPVVVEAPPAFAWVRLGVMDLVAQRLRAAGQAIVPSDNVVALARQFSTSDGTASQPLLRAAGASDLVEVRASLRNGHWQVALQMRARALRGDGEGDDVIAAARIASDRLALALGLQPATDAGIADGLATLLQQVRAAILSEQLDRARALLLSADDETRARPELRYHLAEIDFRSGRLDPAERAFNDLLEHARADDVPDSRPRILNTLANIAYQRNDMAAVAAWSDRALDLLANHDDASETGRALIGRASARQGQHRYDEALADFAQARVALEAAGDRLALARVDAYQGLLEVNRHRNVEALPVLRDAALRLQAFDAVVEELHARVGIVMAELATLDPAAALAQCTRLDALSKRVSDPRRQHYAGLVCIDALIANGRLSDAALQLRDLRVRAQPPEDTLLHQSRVQLHRIAAVLAFALDDPAVAATETSAALALPADYDAADEHARLLLLSARAQRALGHDDAASATALESARWAEKNAAPEVRVSTTLTAAEHALAQHDRAGADTAFGVALAAADASRVPADLLAVVQSYSNLLFASGDVARASAVVGRVAPWSARNYEAALLRVRLYHALQQIGPWQDALRQAIALAGERVIAPPLRSPPAAFRLDAQTPNGAQTPH
jgi:tetratricopeptide (TPR) repeat protein